jgi:hypothetical protein
MVLRAQGADPEVVRRRSSPAVGVAEQAVRTGGRLLKPVVAFASFSVGELRHEQLRLEPGGHLGGPLIAEHLRAAQSVVVAICSIGPALEEAASSCFAEDPAAAVALDAFGSAAVDLVASAMCERVEKWAEAEGLRSTVPLSPGLVGWPVASGQRQIFALLDGSAAGVSLNAACMMSPEKSTSMVIGLGVEVDDAGESCDFCALAGTCRFRHGAASAHG